MSSKHSTNPSSPLQGNNTLLSYSILSETRWLIVQPRAEICHVMGPLHLVIPPYWRANCALGYLKQSNQIKMFFVLYGLVRNFLSSVAIFVPCDAKGPFQQYFSPLHPVTSVRLCSNLLANPVKKTLATYCTQSVGIIFL